MRRSYWKEHPVDVMFTTVGILLCIYTSSQVMAAFSDPSVRLNIKQGELPEGTTIVPFNNPQRYQCHYSEILRIVPLEPITPLNWLGLLSPFISFTATIAVESVRYCRWKNQSKIRNQYQDKNHFE